MNQETISKEEYNQEAIKKAVRKALEKKRKEEQRRIESIKVYQD